MTRSEYTEVQIAHPELRLPSFYLLLPEDAQRLEAMTAEELVTARVAKLLARDVGTTDRLIYNHTFQWNPKQERTDKIV